MTGGLRARLAGRVGSLELDLALEAPAGATTALVGSSGSGKTTLLRALAGLERLPGEVRLDGETWQDAGRFTPAHRRGVGYVFQSAALLPHLSVRGNLEFARRRARVDSGELEAVAARLGIASLLGRRPDRLSGGERQRVAIARALLSRPRLMLLDEPLSGLDPAARSELLPRLREALATLAIPVLYVSHDPAEVREVATRVLRLRAGRLGEEEETPDALAGRSREEVAALARAALRAGLAP